MSETQDLIALYGAIDLQLQHHPELIADIAPLLPGYLEPGTLGWYEAFRSWTLDQAPDTNFPDLETAIANMSPIHKASLTLLILVLTKSAWS